MSENNGSMENISYVVRQEGVYISPVWVAEPKKKQSGKNTGQEHNRYWVTATADQHVSDCLEKAKDQWPGKSQSRITEAGDFQVI